MDDPATMAQQQQPAFEPVEILLVEDSALDAELALRALKQGGLANSVLWVKGGEEALDYIFRRGPYGQRAGGNPRLVLLDLKMPRVGGIEVLRQIKDDPDTRRIPVVVMTTSKEESDVSMSYDLGVNSYVVKPLDFSVMIDVVKKAGYYWLAINQPA